MTMTRRLKEAEARHGEAQAQLQAATGDAEEVARFERARVAKEKVHLGASGVFQFSACLGCFFSFEDI